MHSKAKKAGWRKQGGKETDMEKSIPGRQAFPCPDQDLSLSSNLPSSLNSSEGLLLPMTSEPWLREEGVVFTLIYR